MYELLPEGDPRADTVPALPEGESASGGGAATGGEPASGEETMMLATVTERVFFCKDDRGEFRLIVGPDDKITFGPAIPYAPRYGGPPTRPGVYAVRVYAKDGKTLRAVFPGIYEVREDGIRVTRVEAVEEFPLLADDEATQLRLPISGQTAAPAANFAGVFDDLYPKNEGTPVDELG